MGSNVLFGGVSLTLILMSVSLWKRKPLELEGVVALLAGTFVLAILADLVYGG